MPLTLDHFLNAAANHTTKEIYVARENGEDRTQIRGSFKSWVVSVFGGDETRNQRTETANAFIDALREKVAAKANNLGNAHQEVRSQYDEDTSRIVNGIRKILANQLNGRSALTADVIHLVTDYVDSALAQADVDKDALIASMNRDEALAHLENTAMQFYGRKSLADIHLNDAAAKAKADADRDIQETGLRARGLSVASRRGELEGSTPDANVKLLRNYLNGKPEPMSYEKLDATLTQLRADIRRIKETCGEAIPLFKNLSNGDPVNPNQWTNEIEPGSEEAKFYLNAFRTLQDQYLGPMQTLEYFMRADMAEMKRDRFLDAKQLNLNNGDTATSERSVKEILDDFQSGKQLSEAEVKFIRAASNSRDFNQINQIRPGYQSFSSGGNPSSLMTDVLDSVTLVPNGIWQVVTDQADPNPEAPNPKEIVYNPSEPNPWALAINQKLIDRGDEMLAQSGLAELMEGVAKSNGNIEAARRMQSEEAAPPKSKHGWKDGVRQINQATMRNANEANDREHRHSPSNFARGVNRSLEFDLQATPSRGNAKPGKEYTHGYDDSIDAGRWQAAAPSSPPNRPRWEPPKKGETPKSILKNPLTPFQQNLNILEEKYAFDSEFIRAHALEKNINFAQLSPNHKELYRTILHARAKSVAYETIDGMDAAVLGGRWEKVVKKVFNYVSSLDAENAQISITHFNRLRKAGTALLKSLSVENPELFAVAFTNYLNALHSKKLLQDIATPPMLSREGQSYREPVDAYDLILAKIAAANIAFSELDGTTQKQLFDSLLKEDGLLRHAYMAVGAYQENPDEIRHGEYQVAVGDLRAGLDFMVDCLGQNANVTPEEIKATKDSFEGTYAAAKYSMFTSKKPEELIIPVNAKDVFDALVSHIATRMVDINRTANTYQN